MEQSKAAKKHTGTCHCGAVRFEAEIDATSGSRCNCSVCTKTSTLNGIIKPSAFELLSAMADLGHHFERVGIGGYPEGHPVIDDDTLLQAILDKRAFATYVVTQMCFDPAAILDWIKDIRRRGIDLPVYVGLPGAVERKKLLRISMKIGVGDSARFLTKHTNVLTEFLKSGRYSPEKLVKDLAPYVGDRDYNIAGFHIYTFNQVQSTEQWRQKMLGSQQADSAVSAP